jgi:hypothetical protein
MARVLLIVLLLICTSDRVPPALPLAPAPPFVTPSCPTPTHPTLKTVLDNLPGATHQCAEELASVLALQANPQLIRTLLEQSADPSSSLARRNALRVLGRMAEQPPGSAGHLLTLYDFLQPLQTSVRERLADPADDVVHEAIWLSDTFLYPWLAVQPLLLTISGDAQRDTMLRTRASAAFARLIYANPAPLSATTLNAVLAALHSDDPGVRTEMALLLRRLHNDQISAEQRTHIAQTLAQALPTPTAPQLPTIATTDPLERQRQANAAAMQIAATAALAAAYDRFFPDAMAFAKLQQDFEARYLPFTSQHGTITIRSSIDASQLSTITAQLAYVNTTFNNLLGNDLATPLVDEANQALTIEIFPSLVAFRAHTQAFRTIAPNVDGFYLEDQRILATYQRVPADTRQTFNESLQHEFSHFLAGQALFPGGWYSPGYHAQPKGWADEGLAEVLASVNGPNALPLRFTHLQQLCAAPQLPSLPQLLNARAGYDRFGRFDYAAAWAFSYYLLSERLPLARQIYAAYRTQTYTPSTVAASSEALTTLESNWHRAIRSWCRTTPI